MTITIETTTDVAHVSSIIADDGVALLLQFLFAGADGTQGRMAVTQFEATAARKVLCVPHHLCAFRGGDDDDDGDDDDGDEDEEEDGDDYDGDSDDGGGGGGGDEQ